MKIGMVSLKNKSTFDAILKFTQECYSALNKKEHLISVFLDFSKAFDTICHDILLKKLQKSGIRANYLTLFQSYLSNRTQYVEINGAKSLPSLITCGVPQGSILGPLLFLIYINDLNQCSEHLKFIHFADDSTLYAKGKTLSCLTSKINQELKKVVKWLRINRLSLNVSKSSYTVFSNCSQTALPQIIIDDISLEHSLCTKFLGILVDSKLNFASHIRNVCTKVSRAIGICNKLVTILPFHILRKLFFTLIYPFVTYGTEIWGHSPSAQVKRLSKKIDKSVKLLGNERVLSANYQKLNTLPLAKICQLFTLVRVFKYYRLNHSSHFYELFGCQEVSHHYNTRFNRNNNLNIPMVCSSKYRCSFFINGIKLWNKLPNVIKNSPSIFSFKKNLRRYLSNRLPSD